MSFSLFGKKRAPLPAPMAPPLTLRNLTSIPIELKLIERYEAPTAVGDDREPGSGGGFGNFTGSLGSSIMNATNTLATSLNITDGRPSRPQLAENARSFAHRDVSARVEPFKTHPTEIKATERGASEILRLTFEVDGQRYRVDTPSAKNASQVLQPLEPNAKHHFTAVFLPDETHLAIYDTTDLKDWMKSMKDETPLSALSVPGTHNSPTCYKALPSVRCQAVPPRTQLENGVRFFDIRVQVESVESDRLQLVHGVFPVSLTGPKYLRELLNDVYTFLDANPSECLIMSLKREGTGTATDQNLGRVLYDHYTSGPNAHRWYTKPKIPTLKEVRGKIVLMRRFAIGDFVRQQAGFGGGWGIDAETWKDNTAHDLHGEVCVQDFYQVLETENVDQKIEYARQQLERAGDCICHLPGITTDAVNPVPPNPFYLNFLSASNFWKAGCWPDKIAAKMNPALVKWLSKKHAENTQGDGGTGIVVCDWVGDDGDWDLVRCIVGFNSKLMMREMKM